MKGNAAPLLSIPSAVQQNELKRLNGEIKAIEQRLAGPLPDIDAAQEAWEESQTSGVDDRGKKGTIPAKIRAILDVDAEERSSAQQAELRDYYRKNVSAAGKALYAKAVQLRKLRDDLAVKIPTAMVMEEMAKPRDTFMLVRGQYDKQGDEGHARPCRPACRRCRTGSGQPAGPGRWLVEPGTSADRAGDRQPLLADVLRHRPGQDGRGLRLARRIAQPSRVARLAGAIREFVGQRLGRQGAAAADRDLGHLSAIVGRHARAAGARDPENRLLARGPRLRLQAEFIRDQALAVSGLLDGEIGGRERVALSAAGLVGRAGFAPATARTGRPSSTCKATAPICTAAPCTPSGSGPRRRRR